MARKFKEITGISYLLQCKYSAFAKHLHLSVIRSVKEQCWPLRRRCGTVSFPLFRSLRQLRRRTIPAPPPSVNRFFEKMRRFSRRTRQDLVLQRFLIYAFLRKAHISC
ncbi:hypothetical protein CV_0404 [Chromobacterium violaceum ATCC 12472]|uniref:Uncharacterized protein n=1 Tax=Chromobacterium violaceum (strain ATCC 12472 / DSM 30191 / JCM 1249 / CCUG 213 / NBRC 12614 / NCIMB 9131 / NCTC 9757 / MK) TaxID=243365 RepID=Q7P110_CHRVO|nr:hypothetical protein CV_0404 [Chromobacterium violaceum ATCC 12472]